MAFRCLSATMVTRGLLFALLGMCCAGKLWAGEKPVESEAPPQTVRVAAVQCYSRMGQTEYNRELLMGLIREAAEDGAKIVVLPEAAVHGYMDPGRWTIWTGDVESRDEQRLYVGSVAEPVPGPSTEYFAKLAAELGIYLTIPLIEKAEDVFYNTVLLADPSGEIVAHHRKQNLWSPGDGPWASDGELPLQVVETPYGKVGLMICYDVHKLARPLGEADADIVLYSVGWYGPTKAWFGGIFPRNYVVPNGFNVVAANWSADSDALGWEGIGCSSVIRRDGDVVAVAKKQRGPEIVVADLPVKHRAVTASEDSAPRVSE